MHKVVQETLEILDKWSARLEGHCSQKRSDERMEYRQLIGIYLPGAGQNGDDNDDPGMIVVTSRNLSRSGVSFLHSQNLRSDKIILALGQDKNHCIYMESKIVRRRQVHNDLWEFGVQFVGRAIM
ncbi:MAG: PilZ domain-containing protein [Planctomycetota bacterium]